MRTTRNLSGNTSSLYSREVTFRPSDESVTCGDVSFLRVQQHHLSFVHEALTSIHLVLQIPHVLSVYVQPAYVSSLRSSNLVHLLSDDVWVFTLYQTSLIECARLVSSLSVNVTNDCELSSNADCSNSGSAVHSDQVVRLCRGWIYNNQSTSVCVKNYIILSYRANSDCKSSLSSSRTSSDSTSYSTVKSTFFVPFNFVRSSSVLLSAREIQETSDTLIAKSRYIQIPYIWFCWVNQISQSGIRLWGCLQASSH